MGEPLGHCGTALINFVGLVGCSGPFASRGLVTRPGPTSDEEPSHIENLSFSLILRCNLWVLVGTRKLQMGSHTHHMEIIYLEWEFFYWKSEII